MKSPVTKLLVVNDDNATQCSLLETLQKRGHQPVTAGDVQQAMEILEGQSVDALICNLRFASEDGIAFLRRVRTHHPKVIRILRGDSSDEALIFGALRQGIAKHYFQSNWEDDKLAGSLEQILRTAEKLRQSSLMDMLNYVDQVPTIPKSHQRIISLIEEEADVNQIAGEIEKDASIASKILQIVNSAFYGVKTGSVKRAIGFIGLENTLNLVMTTSVIHALSEEDAETGRIIDRFWDHSVMTNRLLGHLYKNHLRRKIPDLFQPAGLLHSIGIPFLIRVYGSEYVDLIGESARSGQSLLSLERNTFGMTHREAGAYLLQWWEFPHGVVEAALYANDPLDPGVFHWELVCAVSIAGHYAGELLGMPEDGVFDPTVFDALNLSQAKFEDSLDGFRGGGQ